MSGDAKIKAEHGADIVEHVVKCIHEVENQATLLKAGMVQLGQQAQSLSRLIDYMKRGNSGV